MKTILYVEDNPDTAEAVKIILDNAGFFTYLASCGKDCLKITSKEDFDLILLDIMLPDMSGWDVFKKLQKHRIKAKIAFLSALPVSLERMNELKKEGISDYIMKPFEKEDLIITVNKILELSQNQQ